MHFWACLEKLEIVMDDLNEATYKTIEHLTQPVIPYQVTPFGLYITPFKFEHK